MEKRKKPENVWLNLGFNVVAPTFILLKAGKIKFLADSIFFDASWKIFVAALAFPLIYGIIDLARSRKWNILSIIGVVGVTLTGGIGLLKLPRECMIAKEALIPFALFLVVLFSMKKGNKLVKLLIFNDAILNVEKVETALKDKNHVGEFERIMKGATIIIAFTFLLSAVLNLILALMIFKSETGTPEFNEEVGHMTYLSYFVIVIPTMIMMVFAMIKIFSGIKKLTGYSLEDIMAEHLADKK